MSSFILFVILCCNAKTPSHLPDYTYNISLTPTDTIYIDLKNDPDFQFKNNLYWFQDEELALFGIRNKNEKLIIEPLFTEIESFIDGISIVTFDDLQGAINNKGDIVIPFQYEELRTSTQNRIAFLENGLWGYFNTSGLVIIEPVYNFTGGFYDNLALVSKDNKFGYINNIGKLIIPFIYDYASNFEDGEAIVQIKTKSFVINTKGIKIANY